MNLLMSLPGLQPIFTLLAQTEESEIVKSIKYDLPETPLGWTALVGGFTALIAFVIWMYLKDTREMKSFWRGWLLMLRLAFVAGLLVIVLNPQERTRKRSYRPSRVAILVDTSLSMRHPLHEEGETTEQGASNLTRSAAVQQFLRESPLIQNLIQDHEVSLYTFDAEMKGPVRVFTLRGTQAAAEQNSEENPEVQVQDDQKELAFWESTLAPGGTETGLGQALLQLMDEVKGEQLSGVLVVTDGAHNAGQHPDEAHRIAVEENIRLLTVGVGSTKQPKSLAIASVQAPTDVRFGDPYDLNVFVQADGFTPEELQQHEFTVELYSKREGETGEPKLVSTKQVKLKEDGSSGAVLFQENPNVPGTLEYEVKLHPVREMSELKGGERDHQLVINVSERNTGVLILAGGPMRDYRFLHAMLQRHPDMDVDVWLQSIDPTNTNGVAQDCDILYKEFPATFPRRPLEEQYPSWGNLSNQEKDRKAKEYDVVLAFDVDWNHEGFSPDPLKRLQIVHNMVEWLSGNSGGLVLVAGDVYTRDLADLTQKIKPEALAGFNTLPEKEQRELRDFAITDVYPVVLEPYLLDVQFDRDNDQPWPVKFTEKGRTADFLQLADTPAESMSDWEQFEGIYRCYPTGGAKAGATVYANFSDFRANTENGLPIFLASQFYGSARVYWIGSPEIWSLRQLSELHFDRFWLKLIQEAGQGRRKRGSSQTVEMMEKKTIVGQMIKVRARVQNPQGEPINDDKVTVQVTLPNGSRMLPPLSIQRDKPGTGQVSDEYSGQFRAEMPGQYKLEFLNPTESEPLTVYVQVEAPRLEDRNRQQNAKLLADLVRDTGGVYFSIDDAVRLEQEAATERQKAGEEQDAAEAEEENTDEVALSTSASRERAISQLLPNRSQEYWVDKQLIELWDHMWVMYVLIGILSVEWLTRKLLQLA